MFRTCLQPLVLVLVLFGGVTASAATTDHVSFRVGGIVIVWAGGTGDSA